MIIKITEREIRALVEKTVRDYFENKFIIDDYSYNNRPYINEGLTCTYNIGKVVRLLSRKYDLEKYSIKIGYSDNNADSKNLFEPFKGDYNKTEDTDNWYYLTLTFLRGIQVNNEIVEDIIHTCDACGWYLADCTYTVRNGLKQNIIVKNNKTIDFNDEKFFNIPFKLTFRAKFNVEYKDESIPSYLYHIAPLRVLDKIKRQGLTPRNNGRIASHPERVYLFIDYPHNWKEIADNFRISNKDEEYVLLKVDKDKLNKNIKFYYDSNIMRKNKAVYTNEPIPPNAIYVIDRENN